MFDMLITGGTVVNESEEITADIGIIGERIAAIGAPGSLGEASKVVDAAGGFLIPGGIDPHVHFNMPWGPAFMQSWEHGTTAAACGGTTTVIDFAWVASGESPLRTVADRVADADGRAAIDYALHACFMGPLTEKTVTEVDRMALDGVTSIKIYMTYDFGVDDGGLFATMQAAERSGSTVLVHAENHAACEWLKRSYLSQGKRSVKFLAETRPPWVESEAIRRATFLAKRAGCALYVVHMSSQEGVEAVYQGRNSDVPIIGETCPQYLFFTNEDVVSREDGLRYVNYPPLKEAVDREALWKGLKESSVLTVGTDDATTPLEEREKMGSTIDSLQAGFSGVEVRIPLLYSEGVAKGRLTLRQLVSVTSTNSAKIFGLYPRKGYIGVGSDADIVVIDPNGGRIVRCQDLHGWQDYTVYEGWSLTGALSYVISRGSIVSQRGEFLGRTGHGRFLPRSSGGAFDVL